MSARRFFATLSALILLATSPLAGASDDPEPVEVPRPETIRYGYDWGERPYHAHVIIEGPGTSTIDINPIEKPWLALEVTRLIEGHEYALSAPGQPSIHATVPKHANAIFWGVPVYPATWELVDATTGIHVGVVAEVASQFGVQMGGAIMVKPGYRTQPPQPSGSERGQGVTTNQAAYSFTSEVVIETTTCWGHAMSVRPYVTAGTAAGSATAGASLTYQRNTCTSIQSSGAPVRLRGLDQFRADQYDDGSVKVYLTARGLDISVEGFDQQFEAPPDAVTISTSGTTNPIVIQVTERGTAGVYFGARTGAEFLGYGMGTTISNDGTQESTVKVTISPPTTAAHQYKVKFVTGDGQATGLVGQAWKVGS